MESGVYHDEQKDPFQEVDRSQADMDPATWKVVSQRQPTAAMLDDLSRAAALAPRRRMSCGTGIK